VIRVEFVRDRRDGSDVDLLTLHWPQTNAESLRLGDDHDDASIMIEGGQRELWVQIRSESDQLQGRLVSKQTGVHMNLNVDPKYFQNSRRGVARRKAWRRSTVSKSMRTLRAPGKTWTWT